MLNLSVAKCTLIQPLPKQLTQQKRRNTVTEATTPINPVYTYLTPTDTPIRYELGHIYFPDIADWQEVEYIQARKTTAAWGTTTLEASMQRVHAGLPAILNEDGKQLRLGVSMLPIVNWRGMRVPYFGRFGWGHPLMPQRLTSFAAALHSRDIISNIHEELQEAILIRRIMDGKKLVGQKVGTWTIDEQPVEEPWVQDYARDHGMEYDPTFHVEILPINDWPGLVQFHFGNLTIKALLAIEKFSIEMIVLGLADLGDNDFIADGEKLPDGTWRETPPALMAMTDKAYRVLQSCVGNSQINWTGA